MQTIFLQLDCGFDKLLPDLILLKERHKHY